MDSRMRAQWIRVAVVIGLFAVSAFAQGSWHNAAPLPTPIGEIVGEVVQGRWYVIAGLDASGPMGVVYVFDPASNQWTARKPMPVPAHHIMTATANGKIYVFGGFLRPKDGNGWQPISTSWAYDPATDHWTKISAMPTPRGAGSAVESDGKIYVIGGAQSNVPGNPTAPLNPSSPQLVLGTVEQYDPTTDRWIRRSPMPTPRNHLMAAAVEGKIYAIDGRLGSAQITIADDTNVVEEYDPAKDQWSDKGRAPIRRSGIAGGVYNGKIYVAGGEYQDWEGAKAFWAVQSFDPATGEWQNLPRTQVAHHGFAAIFIGNELHVAGGGFQSDGMPGVNTKTAVHEVFTVAR